MPVYRIHFSGFVQGVGFRATGTQLARSLPTLAGEVRNLTDGRVQLTVRGPVEEVDRLIARLTETFHGYIDEVEKTALPPGQDPLPAGLCGVQIGRG